MSLNRVASIETLADHHVRRGSNTGHRPRKLSFSPFPQEWDPPQPPLNKTSSGHDHFYDNAGTGHADQQTIEAVSAFEVPAWKRIREYTFHHPWAIFTTTNTPSPLTPNPTHTHIHPFLTLLNQQHVTPPADDQLSIFSSDRRCRPLLSISRRRCLWLRRHQARPQG